MLAKETKTQGRAFHHYNSL